MFIAGTNTPVSFTWTFNNNLITIPGDISETSIYITAGKVFSNNIIVGGARPTTIPPNESFTASARIYSSTSIVVEVREVAYTYRGYNGNVRYSVQTDINGGTPHRGPFVINNSGIIKVTNGYGWTVITDPGREERNCTNCIPPLISYTATAARTDITTTTTTTTTTTRQPVAPFLGPVVAPVAGW
jgi:hypothetical protein